MLLSLYRAATYLGGPLIAHHLHRRVRFGKEDASRLSERFGKPGIERPPGPLIWFHAASVGEGLAVLPLVQKLVDQRQSLAILVTTGTVTSARLMAERLPSGVLHQFAPVDRGMAWRTFLTFWRPIAGCLVESEIWPNLIVQAERLDIPLAVINGRMSKHSFTHWQKVKGTATRLFSGFDLCLARNDGDAERFRLLGAEHVQSLGDLKQAAALLPVDEDELVRWQARLEGRTIWLAASTHPGEEDIVLAVHRALASDFPDLLTVIVPRHPARGDDLAEKIESAGFTVGRRSRNDMPDRQTSIYLGDSLGELGLFYRLAPVGFIGGSLVPHGGQNPLEAARLGCALLIGPHTENFDEITESFINQDVATRVVDSDDISAALRRLFSDEDALAGIGRQARQASLGEDTVLDRHLAVFLPWLDEKVAGSAKNRPRSTLETADASA